MPLPFFVTTSDNSVAGGQYHRFSGVLLAGTLGSTVTGVDPAGTSRPGAVALIQPATVVSTLGQRAQLVSTAQAAAASYVYIPVTTGAIATSSFAAGEGAPPLSGMGAALIWDAGNERLGVYSTVADAWLWTRAANSTSTAAGSVFTSS